MIWALKYLQIAILLIERIILMSTLIFLTDNTNVEYIIFQFKWVFY